jgi:peptide/nickel transport system permease protein/oligopeptide transport system permease protein
MTEAPAEGGIRNHGVVIEHLSPNQKAWRRFLRNRAAMISLGYLIALGLFLIAWPIFSDYRPETLSDAQFQPPGGQHWCGTDVHGRDLLTRMVHGARISLLVGAVGALVSLVIGVTWGAIAGYVGGRLDELMMRAVDILYALPSIVFVIVLITTLEGLFKAWLEGLTEVFLGKKGGTAEARDISSAARVLFLFAGLGAVSWLTMARIVRGQVLSLRHRAFVDASRSLGASHRRILVRHILPNVYGVIIVYVTLTVPSVILYESFLSYLGLGIQPPMASWGSLLAEGAQQLNPIRIYWWLLVFPAVMLVSTLLALNFLGDGLRDAWDPRGET